MKKTIIAALVLLAACDGEHRKIFNADADVDNFDTFDADTYDSDFVDADADLSNFDADVDNFDTFDEDLDDQVEPPEELWSLIESGTFTMGSPEDEEGRDAIELAHRVTLTTCYWMQATEVTQEQYEEVMGSNPSGRACPRCPVDHVSWDMAASYCNALSDRDGLGRCYECPDGACHLALGLASPYGCPGYRLPSQAEWERAARAGMEGPSYGELDTIAWWEGNADGRTHLVGELEPNGWGLFDMLGNILEATGGEYAYATEPVSDPWSLEGARAYRGGSSWHGPQHVRFASRVWFMADRELNLGFRPVRSDHDCDSQGGP